MTFEVPCSDYVLISSEIADIHLDIRAFIHTPA